MTDKMARFAQKVKTYTANRDAYNYSALMNRAKYDKNFEKFIHAMTVDRIVGKEYLRKYNPSFDYKRKDV